MLPDLLKQALGGVGAVAGLPFEALGAVLGGLQGQSPSQGEWKHPERKAAAMTLIPEGTPPEDTAARLEAFRAMPMVAWPALARQYERRDKYAGETYADPDVQAMLKQPGGAEAFQTRFPGVPLPPSRAVSVDGYGQRPPEDPLDSAIAQVGGGSQVPVPVSTTRREFALPPPSIKAQAEYRKNQDILGITDEQGRRKLAGAGDTPAMIGEMATARAEGTSEARRGRPGTGPRTPLQLGQARVYELPGGTGPPTYVSESGQILGHAPPPNATIVSADADVASPMRAPRGEAPAPAKQVPGLLDTSREANPTATGAELELMDKQNQATIEAYFKNRNMQLKSSASQGADQQTIEVFLQQMDKLVTPEAFPLDLGAHPEKTMANRATDWGYQIKQKVKSFSPNIDTEQSQMTQLAWGLLGQIARRISGEKGVLTERDVGRAMGLIPISTPEAGQLADSLPRAKAKIKQLQDMTREILARRLDAQWHPDKGDGRLVESIPRDEVTGEWRTPTYYSDKEAEAMYSGAGAPANAPSMPTAEEAQAELQRRRAR